jgi:hypothetical protein
MEESKMADAVLETDPIVKRYRQEYGDFKPPSYMFMALDSEAKQWTAISKLRFESLTAVARYVKSLKGTWVPQTTSGAPQQFRIEPSLDRVNCKWAGGPGSWSLVGIDGKPIIGF